MKNYFRNIITYVICAGILLTAAGCGKQKPEDSKVEMEENQEVLQDYIDEVVEESEKQEVGIYVTPAESCFAWEAVEGGVMITEYTGTDTAVIVPDTLGGEDVVAIGAGAFNQADVAGIKLPNKMTVVSEKAFYFCATLQELYLGRATQIIANQAFEGCVALTKVDLGGALTDIGEMAFATCQSLKKITLPEGLKTIQAGAFCLTGLEEVVVPGSVTEIGDEAYASCYDIKTVEINEGVTIIGKKAFETCSALSSVEIPSSVVEIGMRAFNQCEEVKIIAPAGSAAEAYATEEEIAFEAS